MYPFQIHSIALSTFASLIGPFGGFFASGFKRAFKIKVSFFCSSGSFPAIPSSICFLSAFCKISSSQSCLCIFSPCVDFLGSPKKTFSKIIHWLDVLVNVFSIFKRKWPYLIKARHLSWCLLLVLSPLVTGYPWFEWLNIEVDSLALPPRPPRTLPIPFLAMVASWIVLTASISWPPLSTSISPALSGTALFSIN